MFRSIDEAAVGFGGLDGCSSASSRGAQQGRQTGPRHTTQRTHRVSRCGLLSRQLMRRSSRVETLCVGEDHGRSSRRTGRLVVVER